MVNAGAIATTVLVKGKGQDQRLARLLRKFADLAGRPLDIDHAVYISERATGHRNRAINYLELNFGMIDEPVDEHLDLYFEQCSILVKVKRCREFRFVSEVRCCFSSLRTAFIPPSLLSAIL
jgi:glutaminase